MLLPVCFKCLHYIFLIYTVCSLCFVVLYHNSISSGLSFVIMPIMPIQHTLMWWQQSNESFNRVVQTKIRQFGGKKVYLYT